MTDELVITSDQVLAETAYNRLSNIFSSHYKNALEEAGQYILETFYDNDIERVKNNNPVNEKSLLQLHEMIKGRGVGGHGGTLPSKSWMYNAKQLLVEKHDFADFQTYGNLSISHKVELIKVKDTECKKQLINEISEAGLSVRDLRSKIKEVRQQTGIKPKSLCQIIKNPQILFIDENQSKFAYEALESLRPAARTKIKNAAQVVLDKLIGNTVSTCKHSENYQVIVNTIDFLEKQEKLPDNKRKKKAPSGTNEWSVKTVNFSLGCSNNCRYCYARYDAVHFRKWIEVEDDWIRPVLRQKDILKRHPKYPGPVMFPSTHDIYPDNLYQYMIILENLLKVGNQVLIVSKPWKSCIEPICKYFRHYRELIKFRFTIGANDDRILSYWEPDAPPFAERISALEYAFNKGFSTSVSCEPMLDTPNIDQHIDGLLPYVTDSIWLGLMNNIDSRVKINDATDQAMVSCIKRNQEEHKILDIYNNRWKNHPKIKWKESIKKLVGIEQPQVTGHDA